MLHISHVLEYYCDFLFFCFQNLFISYKKQSTKYIIKKVYKNISMNERPNM